MWICKICNQEVSKHAFAKHLKKLHQETPSSYTVKYLYDGVQPLCKCGCGQFTSYVKKEYRFSDYLHNHHNYDGKSTLGKKVHTKESLTQAIQTRKKTCLEKYGVESVMHLQQSKDKLKETNLKKYGVEYASQLQKQKDQISAANKHSFEDILRFCNEKQYFPLFSYSEYDGCRIKKNFLCKIHNVEFESEIFLVSLKGVNQCPECKLNGTSLFERDVHSFVLSVDDSAISGVRNIISPYELDTVILDKKLAIECNGLIWHSESFKSNKNYHFDKFQKCKEKNIKLLQIYEDEWKNKRNIWESIIKNSLGKCENKFNARDLIIDEKITVDEIKNFLNTNHMQGYCRSSKKFVLKDKNGQIVFCITLRKPFTSGHPDTIEIARVCSMTNAQIRGGFSRLMKYVIIWAKANGFKNILTYSDCRYSWGETYRKYGFSFTGHTGVGYDYTDAHDRFFRFNFRAQNGKTENQIAQENNVFKIYNAGNYVWQLSIQ